MVSREHPKWHEGLLVRSEEDLRTQTHDCSLVRTDFIEKADLKFSSLWRGLL